MVSLAHKMSVEKINYILPIKDKCNDFSSCPIYSWLDFWSWSINCLQKFESLPTLFLITSCRQTAKFIASDINTIIFLNSIRFNGNLKQIKAVSKE